MLPTNAILRHMLSFDIEFAAAASFWHLWGQQAYWLALWALT